MKLREALYFLGFKPKIKFTDSGRIPLNCLPKAPFPTRSGFTRASQKKLFDRTRLMNSKNFSCPATQRLISARIPAIQVFRWRSRSAKPVCVFALEPNKYVFPVLKKNSKLNLDKTNIVPLMFAATKTDGEFEFNYSDSGFCNGGFHENISKMRHAHAFSLKIEGRNLLKYLEVEPPELIPKIRFIKMDAEGYD